MAVNRDELEVLTIQAFLEHYLNSSENTLVLCETEDLAKEFCSILSGLGKCWSSGKSYKSTNWGLYGSGTFYHNKGLFGDINYRTLNNTEKAYKFCGWEGIVATEPEVVTHDKGLSILLKNGGGLLNVANALVKLVIKLYLRDKLIIGDDDILYVALKTEPIKPYKQVECKVVGEDLVVNFEEVPLIEAVNGRHNSLYIGTYLDGYYYRISGDFISHVALLSQNALKAAKKAHNKNAIRNAYSDNKRQLLSLLELKAWEKLYNDSPSFNKLEHEKAVFDLKTTIGSLYKGGPTSTSSFGVVLLRHLINCYHNTGIDSGSFKLFMERLLLG